MTHSRHNLFIYSACILLITFGNSPILAKPDSISDGQFLTIRSDQGESHQLINHPKRQLEIRNILLFPKLNKDQHIVVNVLQHTNEKLTKILLECFDRNTNEQLTCRASGLAYTDSADTLLIGGETQSGYYEREAYGFRKDNGANINFVNFQGAGAAKLDLLLKDVPVFKGVKAAAVTFGINAIEISGLIPRDIAARGGN